MNYTRDLLLQQTNRQTPRTVFLNDEDRILILLTMKNNGMFSNIFNNYFFN